MRRVLLGLGVCAIALVFSGTASAGGHRYYAHRRVVVVEPCRPCVSAPVIVQPVTVPSCTVVVPTCQPCVPACHVVTRHVHRHCR
jgi:hypothetical protein